MLATRAVVFVTDADFVVPTLVAASQVLKQTKATFDIDTYIMIVGLKREEFDISVECCISIGLIPVYMIKQNLDDLFFNKTHVPVTSLMRFEICKYLPIEVKDILVLYPQAAKKFAASAGLKMSAHRWSKVISPDTDRSASLRR